MKCDCIALFEEPSEFQAASAADQKMKEHDILSFYKETGDLLKKHFDGYHVWIFSNHLKALKNVGLHPSKKYTLYNGPLECKFQKYAIYKGSLKKNKP